MSETNRERTLRLADIYFQDDGGELFRVLFKDVRADFIQDVERELNEAVEQARPKWISVDERQPESEGEYLINYYSTISGNSEIQRGFFRIIHGHGWDNDGWKTLRITHWMPLPAPPSKDKGE